MDDDRVDSLVPNETELLVLINWSIRNYALLVNRGTELITSSISKDVHLKKKLRVFGHALISHRVFFRYFFLFDFYISCFFFRWSIFPLWTDGSSSLMYHVTRVDAAGKPLACRFYFLFSSLFLSFRLFSSLFFFLFLLCSSLCFSFLAALLEMGKGWEGGARRLFSFPFCYILFLFYSFLFIFFVRVFRFRSTSNSGVGDAAGRWRRAFRPVCTEFYRVSLTQTLCRLFTGFYLVLTHFTEFYRVFPDVMLGFTGFYWVLLRFYWETPSYSPTYYCVLLGFTWFSVIYRVLPCFIIFYRILPDFI